MGEENLIGANEFCLHHNIEINFIYSLQEYGLLEVITREEHIFIPENQLTELEKMVRLHYDLNINMEGIDVIRHLLQRIEEAQHELNDLRNELRIYKRSD